MFLSTAWHTPLHYLRQLTSLAPCAPPDPHVCVMICGYHEDFCQQISSLSLCEETDARLLDLLLMLSRNLSDVTGLRHYVTPHWLGSEHLTPTESSLEAGPRMGLKRRKVCSSVPWQEALGQMEVLSGRCLKTE